MDPNRCVVCRGCKHDVDIWVDSPMHRSSRLVSLYLVSFLRCWAFGVGSAHFQGYSTGVLSQKGKCKSRHFLSLDLTHQGTENFGKLFFLLQMLGCLCLHLSPRNVRVNSSPPRCVSLASLFAHSSLSWYGIKRHGWIWTNTWLGLSKKEFNVGFHHKHLFFSFEVFWLWRESACSVTRKTHRLRFCDALHQKWPVVTYARVVLQAKQSYGTHWMCLVMCQLKMWYKGCMKHDPCVTSSSTSLELWLFSARYCFC